MLDINGTAWGGADGRMYEIVNGGDSVPPPNNVTINHNTGFQTGTFVFVGDDESNPVAGFVFETNIQPHSTYGFFGSNVGTGNPALNTDFTAPGFTNNVIEGLASGITPAEYPPGNFFPPDWATVQFVNYTGDTTGDYHLQAISPYHNAATDGKDIGPNIDAINATTAGVSP